MKQVVQSISGGPVRVIDVPRPTISATEILVQTVCSALSPGTERAVTQLAESSLVGKARARPDLVRQVIDKAKREGIGPTLRTVRNRLEQDLPLGYSAAGIVLEVGDAAATRAAPGQLVATGGAGKANHAQFQAVPGLLCAVVPDGVSPEEASFATITSIALHGLRLADVGPGARVVVIGLGLLGQLSARVAMAAGCSVAGIDVSPYPVERLSGTGALALMEGEDTTKAILDWSDGQGADAVLLTAAGKASDAILRTPELSRDRANVVVVGDTGLNIDRTPFYMKELSIRFARSYGPGRYEPTYEEWGVDYPPGFVRWTEGRNMTAVLDLIASQRLQIADLVTHRFDIDQAPEAYDLIKTRSEPYLGIQLTYPNTGVIDRAPKVRTATKTGSVGLGLIGAGSFAQSVLLPNFKEAGIVRLVAVASASGLTAQQVAERFSFESAMQTEEVLAHPDVDSVVISTPHESHARLAVQALRAGKHVFCEKPLALTMDELDEVERAWKKSDRVLFVGFNRRWSDGIHQLRDHFRSCPVVIDYRVNAGPVPPGHWYADRRQGGRLIGEVCHFVDTCSAVAGENASQMLALGAGGETALLSEDIVVGLKYPNGSLATITYASGGHRSTEKERIEVLGGGRTGMLMDFRELVLNGKRSNLGRQEKGHGAEVKAFLGALGGESVDTESMIASMRTTLQAAHRLGS